MPEDTPLADGLDPDVRASGSEPDATAALRGVLWSGIGLLTFAISVLPDDGWPPDASGFSVLLEVALVLAGLGLMLVGIIGYGVKLGIEATGRTRT